MFRLWKFTLFFLLCLVLALLINLPVKHVLPYVKLPPAVRLTGLDGNLFGGSRHSIQLYAFLYSHAEALLSRRL